MIINDTVLPLPAESSHIKSEVATAPLSVNDDDTSRCKFDRLYDEVRQHRGALYGREQEKRAILEAYHRVKSRHVVPTTSSSSSRRNRSEFILIQGPSGVGKTGLAHSIRREVEDVDYGYVLCIKFCQMQRPEPHSAFIDAIDEFAKHVKRKGESDIFREIILKQRLRLKDGFDSLVAAMPAFKSMMKLASDQDTATTEEPSHEMDSEVDCTESNVSPSDITSVSKPNNGHSSACMTMSCLKDALKMIIRAIASMNKPFVVILDELHWADEWSLGILNTLLEDRTMERTLFIGTCRKHCNVGTSRLDEALRMFGETLVRITRLDLGELVESDIALLLVHTLNVDPEIATPVASILAYRTKGNAFFVWEYLRVLFTQRVLWLEEVSGRYVFALEDLRVEEFDVDGYVRTKMNELSPSDQEHMKMVACVGSTIDDKVLRCLLSCDDDLFTTFTNHAAETGLLHYDGSRKLWCFRHEVVQELVYDWIPSSERASYHYRIGRKLWRMLTLDEVEQYIFLVVDKLAVCIYQLDNEKERIAVSKLCLCAGVRAVQLSSFNASIRYLEDGIALLGSESWRSQYDLSLDLHNAAAEVATSLGNFERVRELLEIVQRNARVFGDTLRAQATMVHVLGTSGRYTDAVHVACEVLEKLGERLPSRTSPFRVLYEFTTLSRRLRRKTNEAIARLPYMVDDRKLAAMQILNAMFFSVLMGRMDLAPHIGFRMVRLTLDYGISAVSCVGFLLFAGTVCGLGKVEEGHRIGKLGFMLYQKFDSRAWLARIAVLYYDFVFGWVKPLDECREELALACQAGLETGDFEFALACEIVTFYNTFETSPLPELASVWDRLAERMVSYNQPSATLLTLAKRQMIANLMGHGDGNPLELKGKFIDTVTAEKMKSIPLLDAWSHVVESILQYLFGHYAQAAACAKRGRMLATRRYGPHCVMSVVYVCGLMDVVYARHRRCCRAPYAQWCSKILKRSAAQGEPLNFIGKHYLLEAELAALSGNASDALSLYIIAISTLQKGRHILQTAIANERAARFLMERNDPGRALPHFQEALAWYKRWGGTVKVVHLQDEIREMQFDSGFITCL